jgi:hypothetical protein
MNKQTAVEWLVEQLTKQDWFTNKPEQIIEQAKEMEKEQIKDAHLIGLITSMEMEATKQAEQYYNETFKD